MAEMIFKLRFGKMRLTITLAPVLDVVGVNSLLPDGKHILMWDFDDVPKRKVIAALLMQQIMHMLPKIRILETKPNKGYIAYCLVRCTFMQAAEIIAATQYICFNFYKWGVFRKRFTLRISKKRGKVPRLTDILESDVPEDVNMAELASFVQYETLKDEHRGAFINLGACR
jgi:hypothetical protein